MEWAHVDRGLQAVSDHDRFGGSAERLQEFVSTLRGHIDALDGHAYLPGHLKRRVQHRLHGRWIENGVVENDGRIVPAQFEGHAFDRLGRVRHDVACGGDAAGESDLAYIRMSGESIPDLSRKP